MLRYVWMPVVIAIVAALSSGQALKSNAGQIYETESAYNYIQVAEQDGFTILRLNEGQGVHSIYHPNTLQYNGPWDQFLVSPYFYAGRKPADVKRVAIVGLAAGTTARQLTAVYGNIPIDGFELDPKIVEVGQTYFGGYQGVFGQDFGNMWSWDNQGGKWPLPMLGATAVTNVSAAAQYQDGSFAIVRNISLIYDVPAKVLNLAKMKNLQLNVQVLNPFIIGGKLVKLGINPDDETEWTDESSPNSFTTSPNGGMNNNSILPRSIVFGLRASF